MVRELVRRFICSHLVSLRISPQYATPVNMIAANLEEIDEDSALILTDFPVATGSEVAIQWKSLELSGLAEYCQHDPLLGFFVEVRFHTGSYWSRQRFRPDHLLCVDEFAPGQGTTLKIA